MVDHPTTKMELIKLKAARSFLRDNGVFDNHSFYELIIEQQ
jgi:hypothetical protein